MLFYPVFAPEDACHVAILDGDQVLGAQDGPQGLRPGYFFNPAADFALDLIGHNKIEPGCLGEALHDLADWQLVFLDIHQAGFLGPLANQAFGVRVAGDDYVF